MDINDYFKKINKETPLEKLNQELFKSTSEYRYYNLGVANAMANIYNMGKYFKENKMTGTDLAKYIKLTIENHEDVYDYFLKLIK